jgi:hypothetical protein
VLFSIRHSLWRSKFSNITKSCFFHIRNIGRIRSYITKDACKTLVNSLVTSRLDYGNAMLYGLPANLTNKLQRVQYTAAHITSRAKKQDHITLTLVTLHWLPVNYRCQYKILVYVFYCLHGNVPTYLKDLIHFYQPTRSLLVQPRVRTKTYGKRRLTNLLPHSGTTYRDI